MNQYLSAEDLAHRLEKPKKQGKGWQACCPAHDDKNPSLSINDGDNGKPVVHCHAGCTQKSVIDTLIDAGKWPERNPNGASYTPQKSRKTVYSYFKANGDLAFTVERIDKPDGSKEIRPRLLSGKSQWYPAPRPLYRLRELIERKDAPVLIVEGEKTVSAAEMIFRDHIVITTSGGSSHHEKSNYEPLQGRNVVIWPDADEPGRTYAEKVARLATKAGAGSVRIVQVPDTLKKGWDLADTIPDDINVNDLLTKAVPWPEPGVDKNLIPADKGNELELSDNLIKVYPEKFAYRIGARWYRRDGSLWKLDDENMELRKQLRQDCRKAEFKRTSTVNNMVTALAPDLICDKWDENDEVCGLPGGNAIDLRTGKVREASPSEYITRRLGSDPDFTKAPITWIDTLNECLPDKDTVDYFKAYAGYCLTGYIREQNFIFAWGTGGNGKSTIFETLKLVLGEYYVGLSASVATVRKHDGHPEAIARLDGARLAILGDLPSGAKWNEVWIKQITGGDTVTARRMNKGSFDFNPKCKLVTSGNQKPTLSSVDNAIRRRLVMMPFLKKFGEGENKNNKNLKEILADELPQIVAWAIEGAMDYLENGLPEIPASIRDASSGYMEEQDMFSDWFNECIQPVQGGFLSNTQVRESYNNFTNTTVSKQFVSKINDYIKLHVKAANEKLGERHNGLRGLWNVGLKADKRYEDDT